MQNNQNIDNRREIEEIKNRIDIVDFISQYINVKRAGRNYSAVCPFHQEKTPSFMISPDLQMYKCFGCGESGDIFEFVMKYEHLDFPETLEKLAKQAGVKLPKRGFNKENKYIAILEMINHLATKFYKDQLEQNKEAQQYLKNRSFNKESIDKFELGYAPKGNKLFNYISKKANFTAEQLANCGLFKVKNGQTHDKFIDRIMFPIKSSRGKVIGFAGRIMPGNDFGPKYLNTPDTPIFHKSSTSYGIYESKNHIRGEELCIMCEGPTDVIAAHQHQVMNIIAPQGTSLTDGQVDQIGNYSKNVLLILDNDLAGQRALERSFLMFSKKGFNTYAANTGKYKDLGELIEKEPASLRKVIDGKMDAFTYLLSRKLKDLDLARYEDHQKALNYIGVLLQNTADTAVLDFYYEKIEKLTGIPPQIIKERVGQIKKTGHLKQSNSNQNAQLAQKIEKSNKPDLQNYFTALILQSERYKFIDELDVKSVFFDKEWMVKLIDGIGKDAGKESVNKVIEDLKKDYSEINDLMLDKEAGKAINDEELDLREEINDTYQRIKKGFYQKKLQRLRGELVIEEQKSDTDTEVMKDLLNQIQEISQKINS